MLTVHHLNFSRSFRILWLLEELQLPYELVRYERDASFRAPASLKAVHPLGKAPIVQDDELTLAESASILSYLDRKYGGARLSPPEGTPEAAIHDEWLHYVESSAAFPIMMTVIGKMMGGLPEGLGKFSEPEVAKTFAYIAEGVGEGPYLMGAKLTLADIQMSYLLATAESAGLLKDQPVVSAYFERLKAVPGYQKAIEIGGPLSPPRR
jgi:glutathione S-transferase